MKNLSLTDSSYLDKYNVFNFSIFPNKGYTDF